MSILGRIYSLIRPVLFLLPPEFSHWLTLSTLNLLFHLKLLPILLPSAAKVPIEAMGLHFPNPVGLAAGFDKNARYINSLSSIGFGFIEVGGVTWKPQPGNPRPRLFRLLPEQSLINRMGLNNDGVRIVARRLKKLRKNGYQGIVGVNIGRGKDTPPEQAIQEFVDCLREVYLYADYVSINVSSPNTPGLYQMQFSETLSQLACALLSEREKLQKITHKRVAVAFKLSPDLASEALGEAVRLLSQVQVDGIILTNTTIHRPGKSGIHGKEGGLSGALLAPRARESLSNASRHSGRLALVACGGIYDEREAVDRLKKGAALIQIYSGVIYRGPDFVHRIIERWKGIKKS